MKSNLKAIGQLTLLQDELGYKKGEVSTVALLGLVGEAGEVLNETSFATNNLSAEQNDKLSKYLEVVVPVGLIDAAKSICMDVDKLKKAVRNKEFTILTEMKSKNGEEFDKELADVLYYVNILATNRGLTIFDLAKMAHDKVRAKQTGGGSSEDKK